MKPRSARLVPEPYNIRLPLEPYMPPMLRSAAIYDQRIAKHMSPHAWPDYELHYLHAGEAAWETDDGVLWRVTGGQCSLVPPMVSQRMLNDVMAPCKHLVVCIKPKPPARCPPFSKREVGALYRTLRAAGNCVVRARPELDGIFCALRDTLLSLGSQAPSTLQAASLRMLFAHMLVGMVQSFTAPPTSPHYAAINRARRHIERHLEKDLTTGDMALAAGLKPSRFHELFLSETGLAPANYLLRRRLERSRQQLRDTALDITVIAHKLGFASSQRFATSFKRHFAITPTAYRRQARAESKEQGKGWARRAEEHE